ncbi:MAG TPA: type II toxin-antitoxin system HicB family antitoxin [archaeon]|nr:type II toxin-antitoxin system HicB family antitoxin [archaeon]
MKLTVKIWKDEKFYVARVPELGVTTQGRTKEEAKKNLREAVELHLEAMVDYMLKHGMVRVERGQIIPLKR